MILIFNFIILNNFCYSFLHAVVHYITPTLQPFYLQLLLYTNYHPSPLGYRAALPLRLPTFFFLVLGPPARGLPGAALDGPSSLPLP